MASENVTSHFPGETTTRTRAYRRGRSEYNHITTVYRQNKHGVARREVDRLQPRGVSSSS